MNRAEIIVRSLLEGSANGTTLRFGPGDDAYGEEYLSLEDAVGAPGREAMQQAIKKGHTFVVQVGPGDVHIYGPSPVINSKEGVVDYVSKVFDLEPDSQVHFSNGPERGPGQPVRLEQAFFEVPVQRIQPADTEAPVRRMQRRQLRPMSQQPQQPVPNYDPDAEELGVDPEREAYVKGLEGKPVDYSVPVDFGMDVYTNAVGRDAGVVIAAVVPGGPSAKAGVHPADRLVQVGPFETDRGTFGPWRIRNVDDYKLAAVKMLPGYSVPLMLVRGNNQVNVAVVPEAKKSPSRGGSSSTISGSEAQDWVSASKAVQQKMEGDRNDLAQFTVNELARLYGTTPAVIQSNLQVMGARAQDFVPNEIPNERPPASETGNQPANPSALT